MARATEKVRVRMRRGVKGEDGENWSRDETHTASLPFARWLVQKEKAVILEGEAPEPTAGPASADTDIPDEIPSAPANADATSEDDAAEGERGSEGSAPEADDRPLPDGIPERAAAALSEAGIESVAQLPRTVDELVLIDGIGEGYARRILELVTD